jgi:hypothetical protein
MSSAESLEWCTATVTPEGYIQIAYRWKAAERDGSDLFTDEDVYGWSDDDVIDAVADLIGIERASDRERIEIIRDIVTEAP